MLKASVVRVSGYCSARCTTHGSWFFLGFQSRPTFWWMSSTFLRIVKCCASQLITIRTLSCTSDGQGCTYLWSVVCNDVHTFADWHKVTPKVVAGVVTRDCLEADDRWPKCLLTILYLDPVAGHAKVASLCCIGGPCIGCDWDLTRGILIVRVSAWFLRSNQGLTSITCLISVINLMKVLWR